MLLNISILHKNTQHRYTMFNADNHGHFIILWWKKWKSKIVHILSHLVVYCYTCIGTCCVNGNTHAVYILVNILYFGIKVIKSRNTRVKLHMQILFALITYCFLKSNNICSTMGQWSNTINIFWFVFSGGPITSLLYLLIGDIKWNSVAWLNAFQSHVSSWLVLSLPLTLILLHLPHKQNSAMKRI